MIQSVTFRARLDGRDGQDVADRVNAHLVRVVDARPELLGGYANADGVTVKVVLRLQGLDRWKISVNARKIATFVLSTARLHFPTPLHPELVTTELTRNKLRYGEGRTEMARPPRVSPL